MKKVDTIIIGSGQGGVPLAEKLAGKGQKVVVFERSRVGGSCVNWGCTPSKAFLGAAHAAGRAREAAKLGIYAEVRVDFPEVMARVRSIRDSFTKGTAESLEKPGIEMVFAGASFAPEGHVLAGEELFSAPRVVIDTGSAPLIPPIPGLAESPYLTDHNFWDLEQLPPRTAVLGGGYIGLELGQGLARLGSEVFIIERGERIMSKEDPEVGDLLKEALQRDGVRIHLNSAVERVDYSHDRFTLYLENGHSLEAEALLVAVGRQPNTRALNASEAGIELDERGYIKINEHFETTRPGVYAMGEVAGQPAFTHVSWEDHRRLLAIWDGMDRNPCDRVLGYAAFTEPQVGRAGMRLEEARKKGLRAREARIDIKRTARGIEWEHDLGFYKMVIDEESGQILGATLVGYEVSELVHIFLDLMEAGADWHLLDRVQHIHPTYAEGLTTLAHKFVE